MAEQKIELRKVRDFGENINDTFLFIKQNFKPLVMSFLAIAGIFLLATSVFSGLYQSEFGDIFKQIFSGRVDRNEQLNYSPFSVLNGNYFLFIFSTWMSMSAMQVAIIAYMKLYELKQREAPSIQEVWEVFKKYFLKVLIYSIPAFLLMAVGFLFCILPGIYFAVVFTSFPVIMMVEDKGFGDSFNRCFELIKENFWSSFAIYFVVYLIYSFASGIISGGMALLAGALSYFSTHELSTTIGLASSVLTAFSFVFYIVFYVSVALHYFTLTEKRDGTGILQRLDRLGEGGKDFNNIQEQY